MVRVLTPILVGVIAMAAGIVLAIVFDVGGVLRQPAVATSAVADTAVPPATPSTSSTPAQALQSAEAGTAEAPTTTEINQRRIGDWIYGCRANAEGAVLDCSITQQLREAQTNAVVMQWRIVRTAAGAIGSVWQTPTGVLVNRGIVLEAGTPQPITIPYSSCTQGHCEAAAGLADDFQEALSKAQSARATIFATDGRALAFPFSVTGLAEALAALKASA